MGFVKPPEEDRDMLEGALIGALAILWLFSDVSELDPEFSEVPLTADTRAPRQATSIVSELPFTDFPPNVPHLVCVLARRFVDQELFEPDPF